MKPPDARRIPSPVVAHGHTFDDPYQWLADRADPEVLAYIEAENRFAEAISAPLEPLREALYQELVSRCPQSDLTVPGPWGPYEYYLRVEEGRSHRIHCRRRRGGGDEEVLLDLNDFVVEGEYLDAGQVRISPDHNLVAYTLDRSGFEVYELFVRDLRTGDDLQDILQGVGGMIAWANDSRTLFYNERDGAGRPFRIHRHRLGSPQGEDEVVAHEPDIRFNLLLQTTLSQRYIVAVSRSRSTRETRLLCADTPDAEFWVVVPRREGVRYNVVHRGDRFFIRTNDGAPNHRVVSVPIDDVRPERFEVIVPERADVSIVDIEAFADHLVVYERQDGLPAISVLDLTSNESHDIVFDEPTYAVQPTGHLEFDTAQLRLSFSSPRTPTTVFDYDMHTRAKTVLKREAVANFTASDYVTERIFATAPDGVSVPISLFYRQDWPTDEPRRLLLNGYGAYAIKADAAWAAHPVSLVDRGVIHAIAHVRGGGEFGPAWWESGRLFAKKNSFHDFIACAEHLIAEGYTSSDRLVISGGSAGGLLVGAVLNMRPDLCCAAVAGVPFVDVLTSMSDPSLRMTSTEYEEWGYPGDAAAFEYMASYDPYRNVSAQPYPAVLIHCGLNDTRVHYWGPVKWAAALRHASTSDAQVMLRTELNAGHFGPSGRYAAIARVADRYAFMLHAFGSGGSVE